MKLIFHGAAKEVGRSCIEIQTKQERYLLDVGVKFTSQGLSFPENVFKVTEVDAVLLSHAHLDHSGGLPLFEHRRLQGPIYCTSQTFSIAKILLQDSYKVARIRNLHPEYNNADLKQVRKDTKLIKFDKWYSHGSIRFKYLNAGHVPGSAMILVEAEGKKILYTADFNTRKNYLVEEAKVQTVLPEGPIDIMISESTYGDRDLPDREETERRFLEKIKETIARGGSVLIPVFALGRAQEVLIMLAKHDISVPIYMEGMCKKLTRKIIDTNSKYVKNKNTLANMYHARLSLIGSDKKRNSALRKQGIFITTSGMMVGGPCLLYLNHLWHDPRNSVLLMGFQAKHTNGRQLLDEGTINLPTGFTKVKCDVEKFDFSGHSSKADIQAFISKINPKKIFFQHGNPESVKALTEWAKKNTSSQAYSPSVNDEFLL